MRVRPEAAVGVGNLVQSLERLNRFDEAKAFDAAVLFVVSSPARSASVTERRRSSRPFAVGRRTLAAPISHPVA